jgi:hypothetical protein
MNHIRKQEWMGCAVATAAMLADLSYDEVAAHWPDLTSAQLRWPRDMRALLESVTETEWQFSQCWHPVRPVRDFPFPHEPVAVFIEDAAPYSRFGQWIVVRDEIVHDPGQSGAYLTSRYPLRDWLVTWMAKPAQPAELAHSQARNRLHKLRNALRPLLVAD